MPSKRYEFRTKNERLQELLDNADSKTKLIEEILTDYINGDLLKKIDFKKSEEFARAKLRKENAMAIKYEVDAKLAMIKELKMSPSQVAKVMNKGESILETSSNELIQPDKSLKCQTCGMVIDARAYDFETIDDYEKHVKENHDRELYETERKKFSEVLGN